jgi:hypothetical protein
MCCGRNAFSTQDSPSRATAVSSTISATGNASPAATCFEYTGKTALTVVSPLTGKKYRFRHPGECLEIEVQDQFWIPFVPNLRRSVAQNASSYRT